MDTEVGRLLRELAVRGLADATLVVFTADHGESLGEQNYWFAHGDRLSDPLVRVPLLLRVPGLPQQRRTDVASLVDLFPTLLHHLAGLPPDPEAPGRDLLAPDATTSESVPYLATLGDGHTPRFGIIEDGYKFVIAKQDSGWRSELFRLGHEDRGLSRSEPERALRMRERLADVRTNLRRGRPETRQRLSEEDRRNLRALGYIEESESPETH